MRNPRCIGSAALLLAMLLWREPTPLQAEVYGPPRDFGWRRSVPLHLVLSPAVIADLGLDENTANGIRQLQDQIQKELEDELAQTQLNAKPRPVILIINRNPDTLHAIRNKHADEINELLTPAQQARLYQIHLQNSEFPSDARLFGRGRPTARAETDVLSDSGVANELGLTDAQRKEIAAIHSAITRAEGLHVKTGRPTRPDYRELMQDSPTKILNVLTAEQRDAFYKHMGQPLKITPVK